MEWTCWSKCAGKKTVIIIAAVIYAAQYYAAYIYAARIFAAQSIVVVRLVQGRAPPSREHRRGGLRYRGRRVRTRVRPRPRPGTGLHAERGPGTRPAGRGGGPRP